MPKRHRKFIIAIGIIATLGLQSISIARASFFEETGKNVDEMISSFRSTLDQSVDAIGEVASSMRQAENHLMSRGHQMVRSLPKQISNATSIAETHMSRLRSSIVLGATDGQANLKRHHSMLRRNLREQISEIHRMVGAKTEQIKNTALSLVNHELGIMNHANNQKSMIHDSSFMIRDQSTSAQEKTSDGKTFPRLAERIIERIIVKETNHESGMMNQGNNNNSNNSMILDSSFIPQQDPRINTLVTNLADLTTRVDERYGISQGGGAYSNSALFNMIAQSQRIKTLDDVKITNATIEGYATSKGVSDSLATYLPLGGGHTHWRSHRNLSYALYHP